MLPQQLNFSDNWKQQRLAFPLNPNSNLCFPMPRQGNRPPPRISCKKATVLYQCEAKIPLTSRKQSRPKAQAKQADAVGRTLLRRMSWVWLTAHDSYFRALKNQFALLLPPRRGWKVNTAAWCSDPHKNFKPCALPLPSLLSQLKQRGDFPRISPLVPHPSLSPFFCSSSSSGRNNLVSVKTWTAFLDQHIKFCHHCWKLLCYLWENMNAEPWLTPVQHSTESCPDLKVYSKPPVFKQISWVWAYT